MLPPISQISAQTSQINTVSTAALPITPPSNSPSYLPFDILFIIFSQTMFSLRDLSQCALVNQSWFDAYYDTLCPLFPFGKGVNPNLQDDKGKTPLAIAIENGKWDIAKFLQENSTEKQVQDKDKAFQLYIHALNGDLEEVNKLLEFGVAISGKNYRGIAREGHRYKYQKSFWKYRAA